MIRGARFCSWSELKFNTDLTPLSVITEPAIYDLQEHLLVFKKGWSWTLQEAV